VEFRILGPLELRDDRGAIEIPGVKRRALLALLLLHANEVVSSDRLMDELWGDQPPGSGVTALQVSVSKLRKALGPAAGALATSSRGYVLRLGPDELDLHRFERLVETASSADAEQAAATLREALSLWRGPPLAEFAYESFAQAPIGRLEELRLAALEKRADAELELGRHADLVGELEALVVEHPLRERFRGQLMLALYRSGRQAEALEVYQSTRRALVDGLGIEPSPALQELEQAILRQDGALELARTAAPERSILAASHADAALPSLLRLAEPLARRPEKELILARIVEDERELDTAGTALRDHRADLLSRGVSTRSAAFVSDQQASDLARLAVEQDVDLLLLECSGSPLDDPVVLPVLSEAPCDVAVLVGEPVEPASVLVPFVGAEHDWAAVELGAWIAGALDAELLLAGPREGAGGRDASRLLASASLVVQRAIGVAARPLLVDPGQETLVEAAADARALVVVGLTERWRTQGLGPVRQALVSDARVPVVVVRRGLRPGGLAPNASLTRFTWSLRSGS
jgi:DNA-binding SARP family transcriptional activator